MPILNKICAECGTSYQGPKGQARGLMRCRPCAIKRARFISANGQVVKRALRDGLISRAPCAICGEEKSEGHHDDYSDLLAVRWLCRSHHRQHHYKEWSANL